MYYATECTTPLGLMTLASDGESLVGVWLGGQKYYGGTLATEPLRNDHLPLFTVVKDWLQRYFAKVNPKINELPLAPVGTRFRQEVWQILLTIPYGETMTYGAIAKIMAQKTGKQKMSAQAVGGAVGHNPISIIIPCHRVVGANGNLTGYAGGLAVKMALLKLEGVELSKFYVPKSGTAL
ncbi:MAG TPA: methylated-DNA--[protein]-cysteine S-methyltransferase [Candidatus Avacidaminococcus intestinavium]|uniref:Methylated-DNA--protein-cysteine methyltransferase n=1 Tax=Candidatus Avacidaminococcus intestinavium TaxID=2840684 RepID=A0A9D1SLL6_9FIRM|nr:methylated-DNA--[protein]-cysteine S-methyltransferase [Candidatus Avacidaminococcus intestinavium]